LPVEARCVTFESHSLLVFGKLPAGRFPAFGPPVYLRFAFAPALEGEPLIPARVVDDWGAEIVAPDTYEWIAARGKLFPRADAIGLTPSGQPLHCIMKELDLAIPPTAYAARSPEEFPGRPLAFALGGGEAPALPAMLAQAVPLQSFEAAQSDDALIAALRQRLFKEGGG
jgi:hypothetical protein